MAHYAGDLMEPHIDGCLRGAMMVLEAERPAASAPIRKAYESLLDLDHWHFTNEGDKLLCKIAGILEAERTHDGVVAQSRRRDGVDYEVVYPKDGEPKLRVAIPFVREGKEVQFPTLAGQPTVPEGQLDKLQYRVTFDHWKKQDDIGVARTSGNRVEFEMPLPGGPHGYAEGLFHQGGKGWIKHHGSNFRSDIFDMPTKDDVVGLSNIAWI